MRVLIFVCGEGLGHTSRCLALGKELKDAGHEVHFGAYGYSGELLAANGFTIHKIPSEVTLVGKAGSLDLKSSVLATFKSGQLSGQIDIARAIKNARPDLIVSDSYFIGALGAKAARIPCYLILNQSNMEEFFKGKCISGRIVGDVLRMFYTSAFKVVDAIIIPDFPMPYTICRKNLKFSEDVTKKLIYSGPMTGKNYTGPELVGLKHPHVLSTIGGFGYRAPIFKKVILAAQMDHDINYTLLSGPSVDPATFVSLPPNVKVLEFIKDQFPYLASCDVIIAPGGHSTMMEAMSFGVPMLSVPDINHSEQRCNASALEEDMLGRMLEYSVTPEEILSSIYELLQDQRYKEQVSVRKQMAQELDAVKLIRRMLEDAHGE